MLRWYDKTAIIYVVPSPKIRVVDAIRAAIRSHAIGTADPTESEIPIAWHLPIRGSYLSGFSTPVGARNPSTIRNVSCQERRLG